jgi:hypothetical protein
MRFGQTLCQTARTLGNASAVVIERCCASIDTRMRLNTLALELERLDELQSVFYADVMKGDVPAAAIVLKIAQRRSALLGLDCRSELIRCNLPRP